jgi:hypothetical protein
VIAEDPDRAHALTHALERHAADVLVAVDERCAVVDREITRIWNGPRLKDGSPLRVEVGRPEGFDPPEQSAEPRLTAPMAPHIDPEMFNGITTKLLG